MLINETTIKVRYYETDQMGVLHHGTYVLYFEIGRTELIRQIGKKYSDMEKEGLMLPVISIQCNYYGPAFYEDELVIKTMLKEKPGVKIKFEYEIYNQEKKICDGYSVLAFTQGKELKPIRPPRWFTELIEKNWTER